jgi:dephospho-CoA kinase
MFTDLGAVLIEADAIVHQLLEKHGGCRRKIKSLFGGEMFEHGRIQTKRLAEMVFDDERALKALEGIIHPLVEKEIKAQLRRIRQRKCRRPVVLEIPLLFEAKMEKLADAVVVVRSSRKLQIERVLRKKQMTSRQAMARLRRQMPQAEKIKRADFIIDNRSSKGTTRAQVRRIFSALVHHT